LPDRGGRQPGVPGRGPGRHRHRQQPAGACCHPHPPRRLPPRTPRGGHRHSRRRC